MKLKNICYTGALLLAFTSCEDTLNQPPVDLLATENFYKTGAQADQGVLGVYADLRFLTDYEYNYMSEFRSDNVWSDPQPDGYRTFSEVGTFRAGSELETFEDAWNAWYKVIFDANTALQKIPGAAIENEAFRKQLLGETHFLRGWAYFELVRLFGNVPVLTEPLSPSDAAAVPQTDGRTIINNVVIPDLEAALTLPDKGNLVDAVGRKVPEQGRADKTAAAAMLARVYMTLAGFPYNDASATAKAKTYLAQVLANKSRYWAPNITEWRKQFTPDYNNKYSVLAIQYRSGGYGNPGIFNLVKSLPPSYFGGTGVRLIGNNVYVEKSLRYEFDRVYSNGGKDLRGEGWTVLDGYDAEKNTLPYSNVKSSVTVDGVTTDVWERSLLYKTVPTKPKMTALGLTMTYSDMKDYNDWPMNFAVIRIEDMMLLNAEIMVGEGKLAEAMDVVNEIRQRAGCDPVQASSADEAMKYVRRERRIELACEGVRWFDEVRYGTWQNDIKEKIARYNTPEGTDPANVKPGRYLYPIPQNQMAIRPGTYKQNPDY